MATYANPTDLLGQDNSPFAMRPELEAALCADFPNLYSQPLLNAPQDGEAGGFAVGDGWEPVIRHLSERITAIVERDDLNPLQFVSEQVKEKFGGLRFYMSGQTNAITQAIREAEEKCSRTCETCGKEGELYTKGWLRTHCVPCENEYKRKLHERGVKWI
ncbi:MAG: hypothetical protein Q9227_008094 [Pyrenula ochraceoflavens]